MSSLEAIRWLFNWAYRCDPPLLHVNPVQRGLLLELPKEDRRIEFLSVDQVANVLRAADEILRACLEVQFFTGIRRYELQRMDWAHLNFEERSISILPHVSKTRKEDFLENLPEVLWAWFEAFAAKEDPIFPKNYDKWLRLEAFVAKKGPIFPKNYDKRLRTAYAEAGMERWPVNAARHTFATYHYAARRDAAATIAILRHESGMGLFLNNYKGKATKAEGEEFLDLYPENILDTN